MTKSIGTANAQTPLDSTDIQQLQKRNNGVVYLYSILWDTGKYHGSVWPVFAECCRHKYRAKQISNE